MKSLLLALSLLATTPHAAQKGPHREIFLIRPQDALKVTDMDHGQWLDTDVVLSAPEAKVVREFTRQNIGKEVAFILLRKNSDGSNQAIDLSARATLIQASITDGIVHIRVPNPHHHLNGNHGIQLAE
jgi:hypothetical protein